MSAGWSSRRVLRELEAGLGCRWEGLEFEVFKGGSRCRLEENFKLKGGGEMSAER